MRSLNFRFLRQKPLYVPRFWLQNSEVLTKALVLKKVPGWASSDKSLRSRRHGENKEGHGSKLSGKKKWEYCRTVSEGVSFEWSHHRISFTDSNVRTTLYSIINSTTGKYCSVAFIWIRSHHRICVKSPKLKSLSVILGEKRFTWKCSKWLIFKSRISKCYQICLNLSLIVIFVSIIQWQDSEKRQSRIASLRQRQRNLKDEFSEAKQRLLDGNQRWSYGRKFWNVSYAYRLSFSWFQAGRELVFILKMFRPNLGRFHGPIWFKKWGPRQIP